jgi:hypothetical protein
VKVSEGHEGSEFDRMCANKKSNTKNSNDSTNTKMTPTIEKSSKSTTTSNMEYKLKCKAYAKDVDKKGLKSLFILFRSHWEE